jgi:integrase
MDLNIREGNIEKVKRKIIEYGLDSQFLKPLISIAHAHPNNQIECAKDLAYPRSMLQNIIEKIAEKFAKSKKEDLSKIDGGNYFIKCKNYLGSLKILNESERRYINAVYGLLSSTSASHSLFTPQEKYSLLSDSALGAILLILVNSKRKFPKKRGRADTVITKEEFGNLLKSLNQKHHKIAFVLAWGSGLKLREALDLESANVDLKNEIIFVKNKNKTRTTLLPRGFKKRHLKFLPIKQFCDDRAIQKTFRIHSEKSGLKKKKPRASFNSLRDSFIAERFKEGRTYEEIMKWTGIGYKNSLKEFLEKEYEKPKEEYEKLF